MQRRDSAPLPTLRTHRFGHHRSLRFSSFAGNRDLRVAAS